MLKFSWFTAALRIFLCCICIVCSFRASSQDTAVVRKAIRDAEGRSAGLQREKLYLQFDRQSYTVGDTIWFKAYLFNSATFTPSRLSSKIYVELINDSSRVVNRFAVPLLSGMGSGQIILTDLLTDGNYTVRAYSNWMQNFGAEGFFTKQFAITDPFNKNRWLISEQHTIKPGPDGSTADLTLHLTDVQKMAVAYRDVEVRLTDGKRNVFKNNYITSDGGLLRASVPLSDKLNSQNLSLTITDKVTKNKLSIPFYPNGILQNVDLQFLPEGGSLITGLATRVGIKAVGENGLGVNLKGVIVDNTGAQVNTFETTHNGMGMVMMFPQAGQTYNAKFDLGGISHTVPLPLAKPSGISIKVDALTSPNSVYLTLRATADLIAANKNYVLIARSADVVYLGIPVHLNAGYFNVHLAKSQFMSGIAGFTLLDGNTPVSERRIFIDHADRLRLDVAGNQPKYRAGDSIAVNLNVCDTEGNPVYGSFSVSVQDKAFYNSSTAADDITSRLLLTSELKGYVEQPGWYLSNPNPEKLKALDLLMLTQGWTGFDATNTALPHPKFAAETSEQLTGGLRTLFGKPIKKAQVKLFSLSKKNGLIVLDTTSNDAGQFTFQNLPVVDSIAYTLRVLKEKGSDNIPHIDLNEFKPAVVAASNVRVAPWYQTMNDTLLTNYLKYPPPAKKLPGLDPKDVKGRLLNEVKIKGKKPAVEDGKFRGSLIKEVTEQDLLNAKKMTLFDLLMQKVKQLGFSSFYRIGPFDKATFHDRAGLVIGLQGIADVLVDGQGSGVMQASDFPNMEDMVSFLKSISADEIKDIKVAGDFYYFISVTTRGGQGYFIKSNNNIVRYVPVPYCLPLQYYRPRYAVRNIVPPMARPTLHWEPNLVTNKNGRAGLSFFAANEPGTYLVTVEGTDMAGNFGRQVSEIIIDKK